MADGSLPLRPPQFGQTASVLCGDAIVRQSSNSVPLWWSTVGMNRTSLPLTRPGPPFWGFVTFGAMVWR